HHHPATAYNVAEAGAAQKQLQSIQRVNEAGSSVKIGPTCSPARSIMQQQQQQSIKQPAAACGPSATTNNSPAHKKNSAQEESKAQQQFSAQEVFTPVKLQHAHEDCRKVTPMT
ncbi:hypothetical protein Dimus_036791, partial [Dionaea muscipula]